MKHIFVDHQYDIKTCTSLNTAGDSVLNQLNLPVTTNITLGK